MKCLNPNCKDPTFLENFRQSLGFQPDYCPICGASTTSTKDGHESEGSNNCEGSASEQALSVQSCDSQSVTSNDGLAQIQDHQSAGANVDENHQTGVSDVNEDKGDSSSGSRETQQDSNKKVKYELQEPQSQTQLVVANEEVKTPGRQGTPLQEPESETIARDGSSSFQQVQYQPSLQEQHQLSEQLYYKEMQHEEKQQQQQQLQNEKENYREQQQLQEEEEKENEEEKQKLLEQQKQQNQHEQQKKDEEEQEQREQKQQQQNFNREQELLKQNQEKEQLIQKLQLEKKQLLKEKQSHYQQQESYNSTNATTVICPNDNAESSNVLRPPLDKYSNTDPSQTIDASNGIRKPSYAAVASNKNIENIQGVPETSIAVVATTPKKKAKVTYIGSRDKNAIQSSQQNDNWNRVKGSASSNDKSGEIQGELSEQEDKTPTKEGYCPVKSPVKPEHKETRSSDKTGTTVDTHLSSSSTSHQMTTPSSTRIDYMTVVFHALLSPHFKYDQSKGDKVIIRGDFPPSGWDNDNVQMTSLCPYNGYTLVTLETQIPLRHADKDIPYKYVVVKYDKKEPKYIWEEIVDFGTHTNRILVILETYRKPNATWYQYDDGIFPAKSWWDIRKWKYYIDPAEGRHFAMEAMLPDWNRLAVETRDGTMTGTEFMETVNQVIYCMTNLKVETAGKIQPLEWKKFNLQQVLFSYVKPRINENLSLQPSSDESDYAYRLATSLVITWIISNVLDRYKDCVPTDDQFKLVFRCLALEQSIMEHAKLLKVLKLLTKYFTKNNLK